MPELELHYEKDDHADPRSQRVGIQAACLAVFLAFATISSHRAHTHAVVLKTEANDQWSFYQSKKLKSHVLLLGFDLMDSLASRNEGKIAEHQQQYKSELARYDRETELIQRKAEERSKESELVERKALRFDLGEGLLEMGLVLASMYFIARQNIFPVMSAISGIAGILLAASGFFLSR